MRFGPLSRNVFIESQPFSIYAVKYHHRAWEINSNDESRADAYENHSFPDIQSLIFFLYSSISSPPVFAVAVLLCPTLCRPTSAMCTLTVTLSMLNTLVRTVWDSPAFHTNGVLTRNLRKTRMRETHGGGGGELGSRSTILCLGFVYCSKRQSRFAMVKRVMSFFSNAVHAKYWHPWPCLKERASIVLKFCEAERQPRINCFLNTISGSPAT